MKRSLHTQSTAHLSLCLALTLSLALPLHSLAASVALATSPLVTATTSTVKPNVMFILDDSGSMDSDYLPDWANDNDPVSGTSYSSIPALHRNNQFNGSAYNPAITYSPPILYNADGTLNTTTYPNIGSPWTSVENDAYGIQSTSSSNLVAAFPDVEWCTSNVYTTCLRNDNLLLPGTVGGNPYTFKHSKVSTGSGSVATGSPDAPTTAARTFGPFYYTINPAEYCDSQNLKNCQSTETTIFSYPAYVRWCDTSALTNCRGINSSTFKYPRYPTKFFVPAVAYAAAVPAKAEVLAEAGVAASASFTFNFIGSLNPVGFSVKVNGTEIMTAASGYTPNALKTSSGMATWVKNNSSLSGYNITSNNNVVTITATTTGAAKTISSVVISETAPASITFTTNLTPGVNASAGSAPLAGTLVISNATKNTNASIKCGPTIFVGKAAAFLVANSNTLATRLNGVYTSITASQPVNGYGTTCTKNLTLGVTSSLSCTITAPVGASACSGGFTLANITTTTNTGPSGGVAAVTGVKAVGTITFTNATSLNPAGFSIKVNGTEIMSATTPGALKTKQGMAAWVASNSSLAGYTIANPGAPSANVTITANTAGTAGNINTIVITQTPPSTATTSSPYTYVLGKNAQAYQAATPYIPEVLAQPAQYHGSFKRTDIVSGNNSYPYPGTSAKALKRTDCAGTTCTYAEEMTNFANWWTYYHTRMQAMKTSVSRSFSTIDDHFRVGFSTISDTGATNGATFLGNKTFELAHKNSWFTKLFAQGTPGATPLRGALSKAGRYYAKKITGQVDPVLYSCQQNFAILSTDGYWNTNDETSSYKNINLTGGLVGNMDASPVVRPMYEGPTASAGSLADVAKYYYDTDLRNSALSNCAGGVSTDFPTGNPDVCTDNVFVSTTDYNVKQHMTTFTMGLGAVGTLDFTNDYLTAKSGDYYNLKNGLGTPTVNWPDPINNSEGERIDDLWHAAVNGQGLYFSAKNPDEIIAGFKLALSSITAKIGSSAAAATSTLNPVAGNNFAYVASYTTVKWTGNLESRSINVTNGTVSKTATWCVESLVASTCATPSSVVADTSGSSTIYNCVTPSATLATCPAPGVLTPDPSPATTSHCSLQMQTACTGTMPALVSASSDTRKIYMSNGTALVDFVYANLASTNFDAAHIGTLSQWSLLNSTQHSAAEGVNLVNYLRGQNGFEDRASNPVSDRLFRTREVVLGDALESQPSYLSKPVFGYSDPGYSDFATANVNRPSTVYIGTNDGMMHAFAADTGIERWAYVPSMVIPNLWKLADTNYATKHTNYVNGSPIMSDVCTANCTNYATAVWRTILVGGLNGGGRGYYALDITDPNAPSLLWEFTPANDSNVGYSFGNPVITKKADGTWVVLVTSGYNNTSPGDGKGYLYVLNAKTGAIISAISTGVGDTTTPSGLARIAGWNSEPAGNMAGFVYGGDLLGNVWRFNINTAATPFKLALLEDPSGAPQPITTSPVLGQIKTKRVIFIATGKYLETSDLTNTQVQSVYAIKDDDTTTTLTNPGGNPRNSTTLVQQTMTASGNTRTASGNAVNFTTGLGWYVDLPDGGERMNLDGKLVLGTLIWPSIVPSNTACSPGGYGWLNYFNYETGGAVKDIVSQKYNSPIVGVNIIYIAGKPVVEVVTSDNPTPEKPPTDPTFASATAGFNSKRVIWRELIQ